MGIEKYSPAKKTSTNEVYPRYTKTRISASDLIKKAVSIEPKYASCFEVVDDDKAVFDTCCKHNIPLLFQNTMKHIRIKKHQNKHDNKIEPENFVGEITQQLMIILDQDM